VCIRRPRSVAWYRRRASRWLRRLTSSAQSGPQYTWPRSHCRQITTCRRQRPQRNDRQERLVSQPGVRVSSCGDMAINPKIPKFYLKVACGPQSILGADCGWAADQPSMPPSVHCSGNEWLRQEALEHGRRRQISREFLTRRRIDADSGSHRQLCAQSQIACVHGHRCSHRLCVENDP
jgi:hypothetical protein